MGLSPVPIEREQKGPQTPGWQTKQWNSEDFPPDCNIGVIMGPRSQNWVDIDLDCDEALTLAPILLPPTGAIFGRKSKPSSHWIFISAGAVFEAFSDPLRDKKNTLLEIRARGRDGVSEHQTLMPPSIADGEARYWEGDKIEPAVFNFAKLHRRCAYLAIACLIRRYVSEHLSERPAPDFPHVLHEADPVLGRKANQWLGMPDPDAPKWRPKHRRDYTRDELNLAEIVAAIPNDCDWHGWNRVGMAIFAASDGSDQGGIIFDDWSSKSPKYDPYETVARWRHYHRSPPSRLTAGTLVHLAREAGWQPSGGRAV
jgi:hypothetical protein